MTDLGPGVAAHPTRPGKVATDGVGQGHGARPADLRLTPRPQSNLLVSSSGNGQTTPRHYTYSRE